VFPSIFSMILSLSSSLSSCTFCQIRLNSRFALTPQSTFWVHVEVHRICLMDIEIDYLLIRLLSSTCCLLLRTPSTYEHATSDKQTTGWWCIAQGLSYSTCCWGWSYSPLWPLWHWIWWLRQWSTWFWQQWPAIEPHTPGIPCALQATPPDHLLRVDCPTKKDYPK
jgi:hypothetical protein